MEKRLSNVPLEQGLRRAATILTRAGAEQDAVKMTQGAMREHGKLMLIVNDDKVCETLHTKDRGEDPTDCLFEVTDDSCLPYRDDASNMAFPGRPTGRR